MRAVKSYFSDIMMLLEQSNVSLSPQQTALQYLTNYFKLDVDWHAEPQRYAALENSESLQQLTNLLLMPVETDLCSLKKLSLFPVVLKQKNQLHYYIYEHASHTLRSTENIQQTISLSQLNKIEIEQAWQCIPCGLPIYTSLKQMLRGMWQYLRPDLTAAWFSIKLASFMTLLTPLMSGYIFNHFATLQAQHHAIIYLCMLLVFCSANIVVFNNDTRLKIINTKWLAMTLPAVWRHLLALPMQCLQQYQSGKLAQLLFDYENAMSTLPGNILSLLTTIISLLCLLLYMLYCQPLLAVIFTAICFAALGCKLYFIPQQAQVTNKILTTQAGLSQYTTEMLLQIHKIRSAGAETKIYQRWLQNVIKIKRHAETALLINIKMLMLESALPLVMMLSVFLLIYACQTSMDTYLLLQFMLCAGQFFQLFEKLALQINSVLQVMPGLGRMKTFAGSVTEDYDTQKSKPIFTHANIEFQKISLRAPAASQYILRDVSLQIPAGKMVAITGRTGAGKTSLLKLLLGLETADHGEIKIDNLPLHHWNIRDVRKQMGVVLQTSQIFPGTIYSNIALNHPMTHQEAWELAKHVNLDVDIAAMPMKMHTIISDNAGESLSGGQKQKILLARALAGKPAILLLDEATSALDNTSQACITRYLESLKITRLVIAHRYGTIASADWIIVLDQGHIIDEGRYADLHMRGHFKI